MCGWDQRGWVIVCATALAVAHGSPLPAALPEPDSAGFVAMPAEPVPAVPADAAAAEPSSAGPCGACEPSGPGLDSYAGMVPGQVVTALGAASCATVSCHGGPPAGNHSVQSFAATIWAEHDRHARAYEVLHDERSVRMARLLRIGSPHRAQQCLVCHSVQDMSHERLPQEVLADGVGCAACHGDATHWQQVHMLPEWRGMSSEERAALGYRDLGTAPKRVATCVRCHVGDATHEVNHDMIAAGHPRLFFEFAAYQRLEPRHWSPRDKVESAPDFTARSWAVGQAVTLAAVADLLADRAVRAREAEAAGRPQRWPEFAEFDCYSCHRSLGPRTHAAAREPALRAPRPGQPAWQPWQVAGTRLLRAGVEGPVAVAGSSAAAVERHAIDIRGLLDTQWAAADRERLDRVLLEARGLGAAARRMVGEIDAVPLVVIDASRETLDAVVAAHPAEWQTWDAAAQITLAMEAGRAGGPATIGTWRYGGRQPVSAVMVSEPRHSLDALRDSLRFPPGADSPGAVDPGSFHRLRRQVP